MLGNLCLHKNIGVSCLLKNTDLTIKKGSYFVDVPYPPPVRGRVGEVATPPSCTTITTAPIEFCSFPTFPKIPVPNPDPLPHPDPQ